MIFRIKITPNITKISQEDFLRLIFNNIETKIYCNEEDVSIGVEIGESILDFINNINYGICESEVIIISGAKDETEVLTEIENESEPEPEVLIKTEDESELEAKALTEVENEDKSDIEVDYDTEIKRKIEKADPFFTEIEGIYKGSKDCRDFAEKLINLCGFSKNDALCIIRCILKLNSVDIKEEQKISWNTIEKKNGIEISKRERTTIGRTIKEKFYSQQTIIDLKLIFIYFWKCSNNLALGNIEELEEYYIQEKNAYKEIKELREIQEESSTREEFADKVCKFFKLTSAYASHMKTIILCVCKLDENSIRQVRWDIINSFLKVKIQGKIRDDIAAKIYDKISSVKILPVIRLLSLYAKELPEAENKNTTVEKEQAPTTDVTFEEIHNEEGNIESVTPEETSETKKDYTIDIVSEKSYEVADIATINTASDVSKTQVIVEKKQKKKCNIKSSIRCLPYDEFFEKQLAEMDKNLSFDKKILCIMQAIDGWDKLKEEDQKNILDLLRYTVGSSKIQFDSEDYLARMQLQKFLSNYYLRCTGNKGKIKCITFIKDLKYYLGE